MKRNGRKSLAGALARAKNESGFTLVELIVVIAILGILAGVGTVGYSGYIKKANMAADEILLDSLNTAFAAACIEEGVPTSGLTASTAQIKLTADSKVDVANIKPAEIKDAFADYFAGNEDSIFKVYTAFAYNQATGMFKASEMSELYTNLMNKIIAENGALITAVQNSAFMDIGSAALLGQVSDVAGLATELIAANSILTGVVMDDAYISNLASRLGVDAADLKADLEEMFAEDPNAFANYMANSTVLNVAQTMNSATFDEDAALDMFASANWGGLGTTLSTDPETGLAQVAMLYGLYTAYDSEAAADIAVTGDLNALTALMNDTDFKSYLSEVKTDGSQAQKDYEGYKSALTIVNESANDTEVANKILENGYDDAELLALLQGVLGG